MTLWLFLETEKSTWTWTWCSWSCGLCHTFVSFGNYITCLHCKQDFTSGRHTTTRPAWRGCRTTRESNQDQRERCRMAHLFSPYLVVSNIFCCSSRKLGEWSNFWLAHFFQTDGLEKKTPPSSMWFWNPLLKHVFRYRVAFLSENQLWLQVTNSLTCKKQLLSIETKWPNLPWKVAVSEMMDKKTLEKRSPKKLIFFRSVVWWYYDDLIALFFVLLA